MTHTKTINCEVKIVAFNRPESLLRNLDSLVNAFRIYEHSKNTRNIVFKIIVSIDFCENVDCLSVADIFKDKFSDYYVCERTERLGLKKHIILIGDEFLDNESDFLVILEDDLIVSPAFFIYLDYFLNQRIDILMDSKIGQFSLYCPRYSEVIRSLWQPVEDSYQNFYLQAPSSWGQIYSKSQWREFSCYYNTQMLNTDFEGSSLPNSVYLWNSETSWKKYFYLYLIEKNLFVFYPRFSVTSNLGDKGSHFAKQTFNFRTNLLITSDSIKQLNFSTLTKSNAVYDCNYKIIKDMAHHKKPIFTMEQKLVDWIHPQTEIADYFIGKNIFDVHDNYENLSLFYDSDELLKKYYIRKFLDTHPFLSFAYSLKLSLYRTIKKVVQL